MTTQAMPANERRKFLDNLLGGYVTQLMLGPGIRVSTLPAGSRQGLALQIAREALQAGQLQRVLERRFEQAVAFDGCFAYLDAQGALVIWHPLPPQRDALDRTLSRMLSLACLETLDTASTR